MQPPTGRAPWRPIAFLFGAPDVNRNDRRARRDCGVQRWVVSKAQILPEPDDCCASHREALRRAAFCLSLGAFFTGTRNCNFGGSLRFSRNSRRASGSSPAQSTFPVCMRRSCRSLICACAALLLLHFEGSSAVVPVRSMSVTAAATVESLVRSL